MTSINIHITSSSSFCLAIKCTEIQSPYLSHSHFTLYLQSDRLSYTPLYKKLYNYNLIIIIGPYYTYMMPIPVAARSKTWDCGLSLWVRIPLVAWMSVCLSRVSCFVR